MSVRSFVAELRRRKVIRVAAFYAVSAFIVAQVADILLPGLNLPAWTVTLVLALLILGLPVALALAWAFDVTPEGVVRTPPLEASAAGAPAAVPDHDARPADPPAPAGSRGDASSSEAPASGSIRSIAVLPFADMSPGGENEYFSDGLTEELLNSLARVGGLRVPARTSSFAFKGRSGDIREIGRVLGVDAVLEGSVRKAGDRLRITAQLIDVSDGYHRWSESYDRELSDIFAIQEEISRSIVEAVGTNLSWTAEPPGAPATTDMEAYDLCFRGLHDFHRYVTGYSEERLREALARFEEAIERDPECATAHAWHAVATVHLADDFLAPADVYPGARASAERALSLNPQLAEAHAVLGAVHAFYDRDLAAAERSLTRAIELNPNSAIGRIYYSLVLSAAGRNEDAMRQGRLALDLDPLSALASWALGWSLYRARVYEAAAALARTRIEVDPGDAVAHAQLGLSRLEQGRGEEALASLRTAAELSGEHQYYLAVLGHAAGRLGDRETALTLGRRLGERSTTRYVPPSEIAYPYIGVGDADRAYAWLERALEVRDSMLIFLDCEPVFDALRGDARFDELRRRVFAS